MIQPHDNIASSPVDLVLASVNLVNAQLPAPLSSDNVSVGAVTAMPTAAASGINTSVQLTAINGSGYSDTATVYYPRYDIAARFAAAQITPTIDLSTNPIESWSDVMDILNAQYNAQLTAQDLPTIPFNLASLVSLDFPVNAASYLYTGTLTITLTGYEFPAAKADWSTQASDYSYPSGVIRITIGEMTNKQFGNTVLGTASPALASQIYSGDYGTVEGLPADTAIALVFNEVLDPSSGTSTFMPQLALINIVNGNPLAIPGIATRNVTLTDKSGQVICNAPFAAYETQTAATSIPITTLTAGMEFAIGIAPGAGAYYNPNHDWTTMPGNFIFIAGDANVTVPNGNLTSPGTSIIELTGGVANLAGLPSGQVGGLLEGSSQGTVFPSLQTYIGDTNPFGVNVGNAPQFQPVAGVALDGILFQTGLQPSADFPNGVAAAVMINFVAMPGTYPTPFPSGSGATYPLDPTLDYRQAKIIDSVGNVYWQGLLKDAASPLVVQSDGTPMLTLPLTANSGNVAIKPLAAGTAYALVVDAPVLGVPMSTFTSTTLYGLIPPTQTH